MNYEKKIITKNNEFALEAYDIGSKQKIASMSGFIFCNLLEIPKSMYDYQLEKFCNTGNNVYYIKDVVFAPEIEEAQAKEIVLDFIRTFKLCFIQKKTDIMIVKPSGLLDSSFLKNIKVKPKKKITPCRTFV